MLWGSALPTPSNASAMPPDIAVTSVQPKLLYIFFFLANRVLCIGSHKAIWYLCIHIVTMPFIFYLQVWLLILAVVVFVGIFEIEYW